MEWKRLAGLGASKPTSLSCYAISLKELTDFPLSRIARKNSDNLEMPRSLSTKHRLRRGRS